MTNQADCGRTSQPFRCGGRLPETTVVERVEIVRTRIAARCKELGITHDEGARRAGLPLRQFQRMDKAQHTHGPWLTNAVQVAVGLDSTIDALFVFKIHRKR